MVTTTQYNMIKALEKLSMATISEKYLLIQLRKTTKQLAENNKISAEKSRPWQKQIRAWQKKVDIRKNKVNN